MSDARTLTCCGVHAVLAAFRHAPTSVLECWLRQGSAQSDLERIAGLAAAAGVPVQRVPAETLDRLAGGAVHQGAVIRRRPPPLRDFDTWLEGLAAVSCPLVLVVDQLQDPQNLGALLRLADAAGVHGLVVTRDRSVGLTPAVAKVASGALDSVPIVSVTNLVRAIDGLKRAGLWVVGAAGEATASLFELDLARPLAWVVGAEGAGLRRLTRESCDWLARIPMQGSVESLNLGTATAVCLFETLRQRGIR
ncbi:MAG: 23S rRNA (guanosine(2251)-2'-O)-methyltransferase RlmB [Gammaproteobacteria bacterium]